MTLVEWRKNAKMIEMFGVVKPLQGAQRSRAQRMGDGARGRAGLCRPPRTKHFGIAPSSEQAKTLTAELPGGLPDSCPLGPRSLGPSSFAKYLSSLIDFVVFRAGGSQSPSGARTSLEMAVAGLAERLGELSVAPVWCDQELSLTSAPPRPTQPTHCRTSARAHCTRSAPSCSTVYSHWMTCSSSMVPCCCPVLLPA